MALALALVYRDLVMALPIIALGVVALLLIIGPDSFQAEAQAALNTAEGLALAPPFPVSPCPNAPVTQGFSNTHHAIDFGVAFGSPLFACADCTVAQVNQDPSSDSGLFVIVRGRGPWAQIAWSYSHLSEIAVEVGQDLASDDIIGLSGNSGLVHGSDPSAEHSGAHLHFAVLNSSFDFIDPRPFLLLGEGGA